MAITMSLEWAGVTGEQYDAVRELVGWERDPAAGGLVHIATITRAGLRVTDVWESAAQFDNFAAERLMPAVAQLGLPGQPVVEIYPNHALFIPGLP